jgi:hypothetical protein
MTSLEWWQGVAPLDTAGPPGAEGHRLSWRDGRFALEAHPDPDADRALSALGGAVCPCLDLLDAWDDAHRTGGVLTVGARRKDEVLAAPAAAVDGVGGELARWRGALASVRAEARAAGDGDALARLAEAEAEARDAERRLGGLLLLTLDRRLQLRLQASVGAALATTETGAAALSVATAGRARPVLEAIGWNGRLDDIDLGDPAELSSTRALLPPTWLAAVWGRGLAAAVPGHVVTEVTSVTPEGTATVTAAAPGKAQVEIRVVQWENV